MKKKITKPLYISLQAGSKDFHVRVIEEDRFVPMVQLRDMDFDDDMHNYGDSENLPESDRLMVCQQKGVKQANCNTEWQDRRENLSIMLKITLNYYFYVEKTIKNDILR